MKRLLFAGASLGALAALTGMAASSARADHVHYVGSWLVADGPYWQDNPQVYSAQQAAALLFGGDAANYQISTVSANVADINHLAFVDGWGTDQYLLHPVSESFSFDAGAPGYNDPTNETGAAYSAYVRDHGYDYGTNTPMSQYRNYAFYLVPTINLAKPFYLASGLDHAVDPDFEGGTLRMDVADGVYNQAFTVDGSATNTIDAYGHVSTFTGAFTNAAAGAPGGLHLTDGAGGGAIRVSGAWGTAGDPLGVISNDTRFEVLSGGAVTTTGIINSASGTIKVDAGGTVTDDLSNAGLVDNTGTYNADVANTGIIANHGTWNGDGANNAGGMLDNSGMWNGALGNAGSVTNSGTVSGLVTNSGVLATSGALAGGLDNTGGISAIGGSIMGPVGNGGAGVIEVSGTVTGDGGLVNQDAARLVLTGGSFTGLASVTNSSGAAIGVGIDAGSVLGAGTISNGSGATMVNRGMVSTVAGLDNAGTLVSDGTVNGPVSNSGVAWMAGQVNGPVGNSGLFAVTGTLTGNGAAFSNASPGTLSVGGNAFTGIGAFGNAGIVEVGTANGNGRLGVLSFANSGALLMQNGRTGDRVTVGGGYSGVAGSLVAADVDLGSNAGLSDRVAAASLSGGSVVSLNNTGGKIYFDTPVVVISGTGDAVFTAAHDAQTTAALASNGVVDYSFRKLKSGDAWGVAAMVNTGAASTVAADTQALVSAFQTGFVPDAHDLGDGGQGRGRLWMRAVRAGSVTDSVTAASDAYSPAAASRIRLDLDGAQFGGDIAVGGVLRLGVDGGWVRATARDAGYRTRFTMPVYGAYGVVETAGFVADIRVWHAGLDVRPDAFLSRGKLKGGSDTVKLSVGWPRAAGDYIVEPFGRYIVSRTALDPLDLGGVGRLRFVRQEGRTASVGVRVSAVQETAHAVLVPFAAMSLNDGEGERPRTVFAPAGGAADVTLTASRTGTFAAVSGGVNARFAGGAEAYVRADGRIGGRVDGYAVVAGFRVGF